MSIAEKAGEISGNNATIAENLQKVYDAGLKAGLAQDPDYAEGYKDGVESGILWDDLMSGASPVGRAREADHATSADNAAKADYASEANRATEADHATKATTATEANHAIEATHAANADHATSADNATNADRATNAGHATTAAVAQALAGVLPVEKGGTGANSVAQALANLGLTRVAYIARGSYMGTETYGKDYPNSLTFPFVPKLVIIMSEHQAEQMILINGVRLGINYDASHRFDSSRDETHNIQVEWEDNAVSWYYNAAYDKDEEGNPIYTGGESIYQLNGWYTVETTYTDEETGEDYTKTEQRPETYHYMAIA